MVAQRPEVEVLRKSESSLLITMPVSGTVRAYEQASRQQNIGWQQQQQLCSLGYTVAAHTQEVPLCCS